MLSYSARYLYQCITLLFCTLMAGQIYAATVTYDFSAGSHTSEYGSSSSHTSTSGLISFSHSGINAPLDGVYASYSVVIGDYPMMRYTFSVSENAADLTSITVTWSGFGYHSFSGQNGAILYIRNFSGGYEQLATSSSSGYITLSGAVASNLTSYVSGGQIQFLSVNRQPSQNHNHSSIHYTDYVKIDLETVTATPIPDPEIEYRMDELQWQDQANEVVDNTGNNHDGQAKGGATTVEDGAICRAGEFDGGDDYISAIDLSALRGTSSMSYWVKTSQLGSSVNYLAPGISGIEEAGGTDDIFWGWLDVSGNVGITVGDESTTKSSSSINNNVWRHVVLTRNAANGAYQIFIDGSLNTSGISTSGTISNSFSSIGRIEDNGGSPEYFDGQLDEVLIYDEVLSQAHVTQIYTNQSAGRNWDDAVNVRPCPSASIPTPLAEFRLDEMSWNGTIGEVVDSVGSYSGTAFGADPVAGKICRAADLSTSGTADYLSLNGSVFSNQGDFTISSWVKTPKTTNQSLISGANSSSMNELIFWLTSSTNFQPHLNNSQVGNMSISNYADDSWHHLVWVRSGTQNCLYIDKVLQGCLTMSSANINIATNGLIVGQEQDSLGGGFVSSQAWEGLVDELVFFDEALSTADIGVVYDLQNAGKNLDGSDRNCPVVVLSPVADWRFDEASWSGANDILDTSGNNYHGTAVNSSPSSDAQLCNSADLTLSGATDYLSMNKDAMNGLSDFTVIVWAKTTATQDSTILSVASANSSLGANEAVMYFENNNRFWPSITSSPFDTNTKLSSSTASMRDGLWHQLVWTRDASAAQSCFLFDGVSQGCTTHTDGDDTSPLTVISNGLIIGQDQDSLTGGFDASQDWEGKLDEFLIFDEVLTQSQIGDIRTNIINSNNWDGTPRVCGSTVSYYEISHSSSALTCEPASITITAKDASDQSIAPANGTTVNFTSELVSGSSATNTFTPSSYTFDGSEMDATVQLIRTVVGTLDIDVTDGVSTDQDGQATDPDIVYTDVAFKFYADGVADAIDTQIAGKLNTLAPNAQTITLKAVQTNSDTGECAALKPGVGVSVDFGYECNSPSSCTANDLLFVNGDATPAPGVDKDGAPNYGTYSVDFDAAGIGSVVFDYRDAGQIKLHVKADIDVGSDGATATVLGSSNLFVVRPFAFGFTSVVADGESNLAGDELGGDGFTSAGSDFLIDLNAYLYQAADDDGVPAGIASDGIPDTGVDVTDNGTTPNFSGSVQFLVDAYTPSAGVEGTLSGNNPVTFDTYAVRDDADVVATLQYDEVGSVSLGAFHEEYLGSSLGNISSVPVKIGRFYPDHFVLVDSSVTAACTPFTYMQQPFSNLSYEIEARPKGATDGTAEAQRITQNYSESLSYASTGVMQGEAENNNSGDNLSNRFSGYLSSDEWVLGVYSVDRSDAVFIRDPSATGLEDGPFDNLQLGIGISSELDNRGFESSQLNMKSDDNNDCALDGDCTAVSIGDEQVLRYGRMRIQSAHGPETEDLAIPFVTEYWNGSAFVTHLDDSCSQHPLSSIRFDGIAIGPAVADRTVTVGDGSTVGSLNVSGTNAAVSTGDYGLVFSAPGAAASGSDNTGYFPVSVINIDDWLRYDWDQDGAANDASLPDAIVTFGRARGNDRMIFWQERYQ